MPARGRLAALLLLAAPALAAVPGKRALTPQDVAALPRVSDPQIAPGGERVAYVVTRMNEARKPEPHVWMVEADGSRSRELPAEGSSWAPRWSPDGRQLAILTGTPGAEARVLFCNVRGLSCGEVPGAKGQIRDLRWSPDGKMLALLRTAAPEAGARTDAVVVGEGYRHTGLFSLDPLTGDAKLLSPDKATVWRFNWSPDGSRLAALLAPLPTAEGQEYRSSLVLFDATKGGEPQVLTDRTNPHAAPAFSPDGSSIVYLGPVGEFKERGVIRVAPVDGGATTDRLADEPVNAWDVQWRPGTQQLVAGVVRGPVNQLVVIEPDGRTRVVAEMGHSITPYWEAMWSVSADGKRVAYLSEAPDRAEEVFVSDLDGGSPRRLSEVHADLARLALGRVEAVQWTNPGDGSRVEGILVWPPGATPGRKLPVVAVLHGGPAYNWGLGVQIRNWAQLFAARGYLVLLPNFRGSSGYGMKWLTANVGNWGAGPMSDVMSGLDHLVSKGTADPDRLFVGGGSYGGYLTSWVVTHTDRFRAAYVLAGVSDLVTEYAMTDEPSFLIGYFGKAPYDDPEPYRANSPVTHAKDARTPTLIVHGEQDLRVPVSQAHELFAALRHHKVESRLVLYPREGHGVREYDHQLDVMDRVLRWFADHDRAAKASSP